MSRGGMREGGPMGPRGRESSRVRVGESEREGCVPTRRLFCLLPGRARETGGAVEPKRIGRREGRESE